MPDNQDTSSSPSSFAPGALVKIIFRVYALLCAWSGGLLFSAYLGFRGFRPNPSLSVSLWESVIIPFFVGMALLFAAERGAPTASPLSPSEPSEQEKCCKLSRRNP
jgi:hypothetical protein